VKIAKNSALIVIDVQQGFNLSRFWGVRNNPEAEANIAALVDAWAASSRPVVLVKHTSKHPLSPLSALSPGHRLKPEVSHVAPDLEIDKSVNSAFLGKPDLHAWLQERKIKQIVLCGIQTNMCVETTARMGGNLGYDVIVALDATHTFDLADPHGITMTADELARATATNLVGGRFASVVATADLV
jgi:Amidases related to nicotinamidase